MSRAWMPLYVADYLADTRRLTMAEHGAYMLLIMEYWRNGGLPNDERRLARIVGASEEEWAEVRDNIAELFSEGWRHKRIDEELAKAAEMSDRRTAAANKRWSSKSNAIAYASAYAKQMQSQPQSQSHIISPTDSSADDAADPPPAKIKRTVDPSKTELMVTVGEQWNDMAATIGLPAIQTIDGGREKAFFARARDLATNYEFTDPHIGFTELFAKVRASPFLRGEARPRNGAPPFRATFDWVLKAENFRKIMEDNYGR